ncbi:MAG: hypothetical protein IKX40_12205 [Thermoguttaceae bacterium]|nr:hypothetical protein [Thermoguttaceae bacterium]
MDDYEIVNFLLFFILAGLIMVGIAFRLAGGTSPKTEGASSKQRLLYGAMASLVHILFVILYVLTKTDCFTNFESLGGLPGDFMDLFMIFIVGPVSVIEVNLSAGLKLFLIGWYISIIVTWLLYCRYRNGLTLFLLLIPVLLWTAFNGVILSMAQYGGF